MLIMVSLGALVMITTLWMNRMKDIDVLTLDRNPTTIIINVLLETTLDFVPNKLVVDQAFVVYSEHVSSNCPMKKFGVLILATN
jgi:hypothetical protein